MKSTRALCGMVVGLTALFASVVMPHPMQLVYNPSESAPLGWYAVRDKPVHVGDYVVARLPAAASQLAAARHYLPSTIPLLKRVGAMDGQQVCVHHGIVSIDGHVVARTLARDGLGRPLADWEQCRRLKRGELFLLSTSSAASFDSRYFGPISVAATFGEAMPLWIWGPR